MKFFTHAILAIFLSPALSAQVKYPVQLILSDGEAITITTSTAQVTDMGMGMTMNLSFSTVHTAKVISTSNNNYTVTATLNNYKFKGDGMGGNDIAYNSDSSGQAMAGMENITSLVNKPFTFLVGKLTGEAKPTGETITPTGDDNPMQTMMGAIGEGNSPAALSAMSFIIPANATVGYVWQDSTTANGYTSKTEYTLMDNKTDVSTVKLTGSITGTNTMEMQGTQFDMKMTTSNQGTIVVNRKTNRCISRTLVADVVAEVDMMGQTMNITSKANSTTSFN